jgi:4-diphosphocytidyl-2-C-methyl-D-erythritol kinase
VLEIIPSQEFSFASSGLPISGNVDNLCVKAFQLLQKDFDLPAVSIHLHKIIPMGAGLGGGSSDAAWTLRMLNEKFSLDMNADQLKKYAAQLGSDCSFFIGEAPMMGTGRGEILKEVKVSLKGKFIVLVKPDLHVSTAEAYAGVCTRQPEKDLKATLEQYPVEAWKDFIQNDFEESVFKKHPVIAAVKKSLYDSGAVYASMSGSGAAVFGIFFDEIDLKNIFINCIYFSTRIK